MAKLKVYRTPIGFHDAYVAAPSQKAALEAWGSDHNLFARGIAEIVTDPALTEEPLASPGTVVKRSRGSAAEQFAALPPDRAKAPAPPEPAAKQARKTKAKPRPDRATLDAAEAALAELRQRHDEARAAIDARIAALQHERADLLAAQKKAATGEDAIETAAAAYDKAMRAWRG